MASNISVITLSHEQFPNITDFAAARNALLGQAKTDWVLFLDSDEKLSQEDFTKLKQHVKTTSAVGIYLQRSDIFYGKRLRYGEWGSAKILRLMQPNKANYENKVHEKPKIFGKTEEIDITILHYAHPSVSQFVTKVAHYAKLAASQRKKSLTRLSLEIFTYPFAKFLLNYVVRLGFLDGWRGLAYATLMSLHSFFVRAYSITGYIQHE
ncbi:MAG: glycosyltransferase family 2 protein [Candidatus Pacebacteria bacterium]|nr:glycosyltransferase family 2 protein [Candidatus Paceibacterota bacterium]PIR60718.1 MAG: hypothetical protein COU67_01155 [Candidatus Pacebacteria bacterium CG10_big_fil_rev_8_21_14_0_10_44_54]